MNADYIQVPGDVPAADLMTSPVHAVSPLTPLDEAHARFLQTGHGALPVIGEDDLPVGILARADCERAVRHGLGERPVQEAMRPEVPAVGEDTPVRDIVPLLGGAGPGRVLVLAPGGELAGIITRSDVLVRFLGRHVQEKHADAELHPGSAILEAASLLEDRWDPAELRLLRRISACAAGRRLYLVGGAVRDLLLDRPSYDLDLMVESDGERLARALAAALSANLSVHVPFGTATLLMPDDRRIDLATSRAELYARPGALPDVTPAGLLHDLARRDFTVNALAMRVDPEAWGRVVDPYEGLADLRAGRLRILHALSFVEDPTRLVRGIRFERTLGMRLEARTEELARFALQSGKLDGLGGERLKAELRKLLGLEDAAIAAARLAEFDAWRLVHPDLAGSWPDIPALERLEAIIRAWPGCGDAGSREAARYRGALAIVLAPLGPERARQALAGLHSRAEVARAVIQAVEAQRDLLPGLSALVGGGAGARFERLRHLGGEALRHLAAYSGDPAAESALAEHLRLRDVRLAGVDGDWLLAQGLPPGPALGQVLGDTLLAVIDGRIAPEPEAERAFALSRARELGALSGSR